MLDTMTSWFSVSDALTRVAVMVCVVCVTGGQLGAAQGTTSIPQCSAQGWLEAREDQITPIYLTCEGFGPNQNVSWQLIKNSSVQASSTCGPLSTLHPGGLCDITTSAIVVLRTNDTTTSMYITNNRRQLVGNGSVRCLAEDVANVGSCKINVITPAVLSDCEVMTTTHETLVGTCNFSNAYSSNENYNCTWTLTPTDRQGDPNVTIPGVIHKTPYNGSSKLYYNGTCSLTSSELPPGDYSYTVRFFPGDSDSQSFNRSISVLSDCEMMTTSYQTLAGTCNFRNAYSSNGTYTCTWTLTPTDRQENPDVIFPGVIHKTPYNESSKLYYNGTCSLMPSELSPGDYSYTVRFFPGDSDSQNQGTVTVTETITSNPEESSSTEQPTTDSSRIDPSKQDGGDDEGVPLVVVIGGAVAAVVVIAIVVVVVLCIVSRRKRRKEDTGKDRDEDRDLEGHVNLTYVSAGGDVQDSVAHLQPPRPSGVAFCILSNDTALTTNSTTGRHTPSPGDANHNTDNGNNTMKDEGDDTVDPGYSSVSFRGATRPSPGVGDGGGVENRRHDNRVDGRGGGGEGHRVADDEDGVNGGYSEVGDIANKKAPKAPGNRGGTSHGGSAAADAMYAKVDKSSQRRGLQPSASGGGDTCDDVGNTYARVNKSADVRAELTGPPSTTIPRDDAFSDDYSHLNLANNGRGGAPAVAPAMATSPASFQPGSHSDDNYAHLDHGLRQRENGPAVKEVSGAQVDKSSSGNNLTPSPPAPEGHVDQHASKPKPAVRSKPVV